MLSKQRYCIHFWHFPKKKIEHIIDNEKLELLRRNQLYRHGAPLSVVKGRSAIIVDDGLATGATMHAAVQALKHAGAGRIVVAVPVGSEDACLTLRQNTDELICLEIPQAFSCVGEWYQSFDQVTDEEVISIAEQMTWQKP